MGLLVALDRCSINDWQAERLASSVLRMLVLDASCSKLTFDHLVLSDEAAQVTTPVAAKLTVARPWASLVLCLGLARPRARGFVDVTLA